MNMNQFYEIGHRGQCPSCRGTNVRRGIKSMGGKGPGIWECTDCGGIPSLCNADGRGVVYISHDIKKCAICHEASPDSETHMVNW